MDKPPAQSPPQPTPITTPVPTPITTPQPTPITVPTSITAPQQPPPSPQPLEWLIRPKPSALLLILKSVGEQHVSALAKKSSMSYVHALGMLKKLEEKGLVTTELKGNKRIVKLTEPGVSFVSSLEDLIKKAPVKRV